MSSARHTCNCDECVYSRTRRQELQHGGTDWDLDNEAPTRYRKAKKHNRKVCSKSKKGEPCDDLGRMVKGTKPRYNIRTREYEGNEPRYVKCCSRCGRQQSWGWYYY